DHDLGAWSRQLDEQLTDRSLLDLFGQDACSRDVDADWDRLTFWEPTVGAAVLVLDSVLAATQATSRNRRMAEGMIYAAHYGSVEFAIPHFDRFVRMASPLSLEQLCVCRSGPTGQARHR
ncbi:MAG: hypothetical protein ACNYZH_08065, partial [Acidimicrobiia bacterium]